MMRRIKIGLAAAAFAVMGLLLVSCERGDVKSPAKDTGGYSATPAPKQSEGPATGGYGATPAPKQTGGYGGAAATGGYGK